MKWRKLVSRGLILTPFILLGMGAQAESQPSADFEKCMENVDLSAMKNSQWGVCAAAEVKRQDVILNVEYKKLRIRLLLSLKKL